MQPKYKYTELLQNSLPGELELYRLMLIIETSHNWNMPFISLIKDKLN